MEAAVVDVGGSMFERSCPVLLPPRSPSSVISMPWWCGGTSTSGGGGSTTTVTDWPPLVDVDGEEAAACRFGPLE